MSLSSSKHAIRTKVAGMLYHDPALVGGVAVALLAGTHVLFGLPVDVPLLVVAFCGTTLVYATDRVWTSVPEDRVNRPARVAWVQASGTWLAVETAVLFALGGAMLLYLEWTTLLGAGLLGSIAGLHVAPLSENRGAFSGHWKPVVLAGTWAAGGTLLPLIEAGHPVGGGALLFFVYRGLLILPNLLLADWADREGDAAAGLAPWATEWTIRQVRCMSTVVLLIGAAGAGGWIVVGVQPLLVGIDGIGVLLMMGVVWGLDPTRPRTALVADLVVGWPLVPALVAWMIV